MNSRLFYTVTIVISVILAFALCGCKDNKHKINPRVQELDEIPDSALLVQLDKVEHDSIFVSTIGGAHTKHVYGINEANAQGKIKGSLTVGDWLSIFPQEKNKNILISINVTELSGQWFYDMRDHRGFKFEPHGGLSTINNVEISFREWKLLNGKLYLYFVDMQQASTDRHEDGVEEAEILSLNKEEMRLRFRGSTLDCRRQHEPIKFH